MRERGEPTPDEVVMLEDCSITIRTGICCGERFWYAVLPGYWQDTLNLRESKYCCTFAEHYSREDAIACARARIAQGLTYHEAFVEPG